MIVIQGSPPAQYYRELAREKQDEESKGFAMTFAYAMRLRKAFSAFVQQTKEVRDLQKEYFKSKETYKLLKCKAAENELDSAILDLMEAGHV